MFKAIKVKKPGGLDNLSFESIDPRKPDVNEIQVEIKASSLIRNVISLIHCFS